MPPPVDDDVHVSCLMVTTADRFPFAVRSIAAYCAQTHAARELVIVAAPGPAADLGRLHDHVATLARPDIRLVPIPTEMTLGAARNRSIAEARGRFICQWDDDDLHHPSRIAAQLAALRASGRPACCLESVIQYIVNEEVLYLTHWGGTLVGAHPGTLVADKRIAIRYPETGSDARRGEDTVAVGALAQAGQVHALKGQPHLFVYVTHGRNTWSTAHHRMLAERLAIRRAPLIAQDESLRSNLRVFGLPPHVTVCGSDGAAFALGGPADGPQARRGPALLDAEAAWGKPGPEPTILLAQEFGGNLGHVLRLLAVARALGPARFVVAVPHAAVVRDKVAEALGPDVEVVGHLGFFAPDHAQTRSVRDHTLADVFHNIGYGHTASLDHAADRWRALIDRVAPDLIVCEFAPTVRLVAWGQVPVVVMGGSYETPPPGIPLPTVVPAGEPPGADSLRHEQHLLAVAGGVRRRLGGPPLRHFGDLFQGERVFTIVPPGCDPYAKQRRDRTFPPFPAADTRCGPAFSARTGPDVFCFLWANHPRLDLILTALNGLPRRSEVHIRGVDPRRLIPQCAPQVGIRPDAADFASLLPQTRVFLHYGGAAASYAGLLAGAMQIIVPIHLEQEMTARGMVDNGAALGLMLDANATAERLRAIIAAVLEDTALQASTLTAARRARAARTGDPLPAIVVACRELLGRSASSTDGEPKVRLDLPDVPPPGGRSR